MTDVAAAPSPDAPGSGEGFDEYANEVLTTPVTWPLNRSATVGQRQSDFSVGVRAELHYAMNMRQLGQKYLASHPTVQAEAVVWRLVAAVSIAVSIAACGALLTVVALTGASLRPNPYLAVAVLLVGVALGATVATAVHGGRPRFGRR